MKKCRHDSSGHHFFNISQTWKNRHLDGSGTAFARATRYADSPGGLVDRDGRSHHYRRIVLLVVRGLTGRVKDWRPTKKGSLSVALLHPGLQRMKISTARSAGTKGNAARSVVGQNRMGFDAN
jgi:hypothetical protein